MNGTDNSELIKQLENRMIEGFASVEKLITKSEDMNKERTTDIKHTLDDHNQRLNKLESSLAYNVGKIAGISAAIGAAGSLIALLIKGGA